MAAGSVDFFSTGGLGKSDLKGLINSTLSDALSKPVMLVTFEADLSDLFLTESLSSGRSSLDAATIFGDTLSAAAVTSVSVSVMKNIATDATKVAIIAPKRNLFCLISLISR